MLRRKFLSFLSAAALAGACKPTPGPDGGPSVTPGSVLGVIETVMGVLNVILPVIRVFMVRLIPDGVGKVAVLSATDYVVAVAGDWQRAADTYRARGGDACALYALTGTLTEALVSLAGRLTGVGFGWGQEIAQLVSDLGLLADRLVGRCAADAGDLSDAQVLSGAGATTSVSDRAANRLADIAADARARGVALRPLPPIRLESLPR